MIKTIRLVAGMALLCVASGAFAQSLPQLAAPLAATLPTQWNPGPGWDRDIEFQCNSDGYQYRMCQVDTGRGGDVRLTRQISNTPCIEGRTWGWNRAGVWVDQGCAAVFRVSRRWSGGGPGYPGQGGYPGSGNGGWNPGPNWDQSIRFRCSSQGYNYNLCQVDTGRGSRVYIAKQLSNTPCIEGRNWGWNRGGVWVDQGCSAEFVVDRRWR